MNSRKLAPTFSTLLGYGPALPADQLVNENSKLARAMLTHLPEDITDAESNRRADMAEEMLREIKRWAGNNG